MKQGSVPAWQVYLIALGGASLLLFIGILGVHKTISIVYVEQPYASTVAGELVASASIGQTFIAKYSGLCGVELYLGTYARQNMGLLVFRLQTTVDTTDLVTTVVDITQVRDNTYYAFEFAPLRNMVDKSLYFFIEAPQSTSGNAITAWGTTDDVYAGGEAVLKNVHRSDIRDLKFRLKYCPSLAEKANLFLHRLAANKPSVWGDTNLYICLGILYLILIYTILVFAVKGGKKTT